MDTATDLYINGHWQPGSRGERFDVLNPAAPFGGVKQSGLGREGGHEGLLEFMESPYISVEW